jgi:hypothetical protein
MKISKDRSRITRYTDGTTAVIFTEEMYEITVTLNKTFSYPSMDDNKLKDIALTTLTEALSG